MSLNAESTVSIVVFFSGYTNLRESPGAVKANYVFIQPAQVLELGFNTHAVEVLTKLQFPDDEPNLPKFPCTFMVGRAKYREFNNLTTLLLLTIQ